MRQFRGWARAGVITLSVLSGLLLPGAQCTGLSTLPGGDMDGLLGDLSGVDDEGSDDSDEADDESSADDSSDGDSDDSTIGSVVNVDGALTKTYQQGSDGYESTRAADISTLNIADYNLYQGSTFTDGSNWCIGDIPSYGYSISPLVRFEDLDLPAGAKVVAASLTLTFVDTYEEGQSVVGHYLKEPWATEAGYGGTGVGWTYRQTGVAWAEPGARGVGTDVFADHEFSYSGFVSGQELRLTADLSAEIVQGWVDNPATNHGVVLTVDLLDHHTGMIPPRSDRADDRPMLSITYLVSGE